MSENSQRSVHGVQMGKSGPLECVELANQIQGFRIADHWDASEKNNYKYYTYMYLSENTDNEHLLSYFLEYY